MTPEKEREIGDRVAQFLHSPEWAEAFHAYRMFLLGEIEREDDPARVMSLKAHLRAATAARLHLESLVKHGALAAAQIDIEEKQRGFLRRFMR